MFRENDQHLQLAMFDTFQQMPEKARKRLEASWAGTFVRVIKRYTRELPALGNRLMLVGLNARVVEQLEKTGLLDLTGEENVILGRPCFGAALERALAAPQAWTNSAVRFSPHNANHLANQG